MEVYYVVVKYITHFWSNSKVKDREEKMITTVCKTSLYTIFGCCINYDETRNLSVKRKSQ